MRHGLFLAAVLFACSACARVGFSTGGDARENDRPVPDRPSSDLARSRDAPGDRALAEAAPPLFTDNFSTATIDPAWSLWRRVFAIQNGRLTALPQPRLGFNYGHGGNGRGATAITHVGDSSWRDYRLSFDIEATPVVASWNPYGLPACWRAISVMFRVAQYVENWNTPAVTQYSFDLDTGCTLGQWTLARANGQWMTGTGWSASTQQGASFLLGQSVTTAAKDGPNHIVIEVRGTRLLGWVNEVKVFDVLDNAPRTADSGWGGSPIPSGGVGVHFPFECNGWIDNFHVDTL